MPPPVPQQGSRAGLIVALVIFVILSVLFAVFFFDERGKRQKAENDVVEEQAKHVGYEPQNRDAGDIKVFKDMASGQSSEEGGVNSSGYKKVGDTLAPPTANNAFDIANGERLALIKAITPMAVNGRQAVDYIALSKKQAQDILNTATTRPSIVWNQDMGRVLQEVANYAIERDREVQTVKKEVEAEKKETEKANAAFTASKATFDTQLAAQTAKVGELEKSIAGLKAAYDAQVQPIRTDYEGKMAAQAAQIPPLNAQIASLTAQLASIKAYNEHLQGMFRQFHMDASENTVRRPDGYITRIADDGKTVYINLGESDHLTAGMTFQIYDKNRGIAGLKDDNPAMEDENVRRSRIGGKNVAAANTADKSAQAQMLIGRQQYIKFDTQLPSGGKGSIEVVSVGPGHSSVCRVIKLEPGTTLQQGDLIANLVYDPYIKPKVAIYGNFDLDYNGVPDLRDADTIRRQVETWGGKASMIKAEDEVFPDFDYLVMGVRPKPQQLGADATPDQIAANDLIKAEAAKYDKVAEKARAFSIPVLNQTRFLYYTGYFDQRLR